MNDNKRDDEKFVKVINKRNKAVFAVPLKEACELLENFEEFIETDEELPVEPEKETELSADEQQILGLNEEEIVIETDEELPVEPEKEHNKPSKKVEATQN